jgi:hypothetical protein
MKKTYIAPTLAVVKVMTTGFLALSNPDADTLRGGNMGDAGTTIEQLGREAEFDDDEY